MLPPLLFAGLNACELPKYWVRSYPTPGLSEQERQNILNGKIISKPPTLIDLKNWNQIFAREVPITAISKAGPTPLKGTEANPMLFLDAWSHYEWRSNPASTRFFNIRTTAYHANESDHIIYGNSSAVGTPLKSGLVNSAASDWSRFPLGTRFRILGQPNITYEIDDYGGALVGTGTIDIYRPDQQSMDAWGVRRVGIEIVRWGSFQEGLKIMEARSNSSHVRRMVDRLVGVHNPEVYNLKTKQPADILTVLADKRTLWLQHHVELEIIDLPKKSKGKSAKILADRRTALKP